MPAVDQFVNHRGNEGEGKGKIYKKKSAAGQNGGPGTYHSEYGGYGNGRPTDVSG